MKPLPLQDIRQAVAGQSLTALRPDAPPIRAVCTDTRAMKPNSLYVALVGDRFDGHAFLEQARAGGATAAVVQKPIPNPPHDMQIFQVADTRIALGKLARRVRQDLRGRVIAVAGSNGKTSTKCLIHAALAGRFRGSVSPKSFNNDIGVPLTIFAADPIQDYTVLEIGTNHPGEIANLTNIARPDIAVLTNAGAEHLEGLGSLEGVRRENASIIWGLDPAKGLLIVNGDDPSLLEAVSQWRGARLTFGFDSKNDLFAADVRCDQSGVRFKLNASRREVFVPLLGRHSAANALAAIAVGRRLGVQEEKLFENLAVARGPEMRMELAHLPGGVTMVNDAYNANPDSMRAALDTVNSIRPPAGRLVLVLGSMLELGPQSADLHREIGQRAVGIKPDLLFCVGAEASHIADGAAGLSPDTVRRYPDSTAAKEAIASAVRRGDLVLLKGSRGVKLEAIASALAGRGGAEVDQTT